MSPTTQRKSSPALTGDLLTARAVNREADNLREGFRLLKEPVDYPLPFIVWSHRLNEEETKRLQKLLCADGAIRDAELLPKIKSTLLQMQRGKLVQVAA